MKTVLNLCRARPKLVRLPAALSAAGCCGESSCAPDDIIVIACQVLFFQADPAVARAGRVTVVVVVGVKAQIPGNR